MPRRSGREAGAGAARREAGELADEILAALWAAGGPATVGEIHAALGDPAMGYKTVLTVLIRLHDKGLVERVRAGRAHTYTPVLAPADLAAERMSAVLAGREDQSAVLQRFLARLGPAESATLRELLDGPA